MGIFDRFKNKTLPTIENENRLETVLRKAANEAAYRPEFYEKILSEKLVVLTAATDLPDGVQTLKQNTNVNIVSFADGKIPVFTSVAKIFDKGIINEEVPFLEMKGQDLFEVTKGATFILNPYSDVGKELLPAEIESMLNGAMMTENHQKIVVEEETQVQLGQPAVYPTAIVNSLKILFASKPSVQKAYLGWIYNPSSGEPPHYIFAFDATGDLESITHEAGFIAKQFLNSDEFVDFIQIDQSEGLSEYFVQQTTPF